ncbi:MAG: hypothetical protein KDH98_08930 [Calditrichaeota bacterium]|nr:hypothetical protein [Calditrichota bacterium]
MSTQSSNGNGNKSFIDESTLTIEPIFSRVFINSLTLENNELVQLLAKVEESEDRINEFKKIVDLGAFVKNKVQMFQDTDYLDRRISEMTNEFQSGIDQMRDQLVTAIDDNFDPSKANSYTEQINRFFESKKREFSETVTQSLKALDESNQRFSTKIDQSFNPNLKGSHLSRLTETIDLFQKNLQRDFDINQLGSITNQIKTMVHQTFKEDGELLKTIDRRFSFDNPNSIVVLLQNNILHKLEELKTELITSRTAAETEQAAKEKSVHKGYDFEDKLFEQLEGFARQHGDIVADVSRTDGAITRSRKGDFLYTITSLKKTIAVEAKNRAMETPARLLPTLEQTKINRKADYVIYISENELQLHKQVGEFQEYPPDKLITHFKLWEVALKIAISRLTLENSIIEGIDKLAVENEITVIQNAIKTFRTIRTAANNVINESNKILAQASQIQNDISSSVNNLTELIMADKENEGPF